MVISCPGCKARYRLEASLLEGYRAVRFRCRSCGGAFLVENPKAAREKAASGTVPVPAASRKGPDAGRIAPERTAPAVPRGSAGLPIAGAAAPSASLATPGSSPEGEPQTARDRDVAPAPEPSVPAGPPRTAPSDAPVRTPSKRSSPPGRFPLNVVPFPVREKADLSERIRPIPEPGDLEEPPGEELPADVAAPAPAAEGGVDAEQPALPGAGVSDWLHRAVISPPAVPGHTPDRPEGRTPAARPAAKGGRLPRSLYAALAVLVFGVGLFLLAPSSWKAPLKSFFGIRDLPVRYEVIPHFAGYRETPLAGTVYLFEGAIRVREGTLRTDRLRIWVSFLDGSEQVVAEKPFLVAEQSRAGVQLEGSREKIEEALARANGLLPDRIALAGEDVPVTALLLDPPKGIASYRIKSYYEGES